MSQFLILDAEHRVQSICSTEPEDEHRPYDGEPVSLRDKPHYGAALFWLPDADAPEWIDTRTLDQARADRVSAMRADCDTAILSGFTSSALGVAYLYPAKLTDQTNLAGSILASILPGNANDWATPFWCADSAGDWQFRMHTAAQIQQVGRDGKAAILSAMTTNESLRTAIMDAPTIAEVDAIGWPA